MGGRLLAIRLRFLQEADPGAHIIHFWTWSQINHVDIILPEGYLGARIIGGVQIRSFNYVKPIKEWFTHIDVTPEVEQKAIAWARLQIGKSYDWSAILGFGFKRDWHQDSSWNCSELAGEMFVQGGDPLFNEEMVSIDRVTPRDLAVLGRVVIDKVVNS